VLFFFRCRGGIGYNSTSTLSFSRLQIISRKLLCNVRRVMHETVEQNRRFVHKTVAPHSTNIDTSKTGVTHRWMRKRCSRGFSEQGESSPCLMASSRVTQRHSTVRLPAPKFYTSLAPPSPPPPRNLSTLPSSLSFLENITQYTKKNSLLSHFHAVNLPH
jgi:hypothetical protein